MSSRNDYVVSRIDGDSHTLNIKMPNLRTGNSLHKNYDIRKFMDTTKFSFPQKIRKLIPQNTPSLINNEGRYFERAARALALFKQCALVGPSGSGKTHTIYLIAELAGLPLWEINCGLQTSVFDLFGRYVGLGKENWIDGLITSWCRYGGLLYMDEVNMMRPDIVTRLNPILDQRSHLILTEKDNEIIPRHKDAFLIMSMNPVSGEFPGTKPINAAIRRRMSVWINFDYMSVGSKIEPREVDLIIRLTNIDAWIAKKMVMVGATLRELYKSGEIAYAPSVGDLTNWARLVSSGETFSEGAEETIIAPADEDVENQKIIRRLITRISNH